MRGGSWFSFDGVLLALVGCVLLSVIAPFWQRRESALEQEVADRDLQTIAAAFERYRRDFGLWPPHYTGLGDYRVSLTTLTCLVHPDHRDGRWSGPYLPVDDQRGAVLSDPWGCSYQVLFFQREGKAGLDGAIAVVSSGPNGVHETPFDRAALGQVLSDDRFLWVTRRL